MIQIIWMLGGVFLVAVMFALAHRLHAKLGLAPTFAMVFGLQHMQTNLATSVYVETFPGVFLSPGSVVLFMATMSIVLAIYIMEGAEESRRFIYGILITNVAIFVLGKFTALQTLDVPLGSPGTEYISLLVSSFRVFAGGTIALAIDVIAVIVIYEYVSEKTSNTTLRLTITLALIALLDSVLFGVLAFVGTEFWTIGLIYSAIAKMISGIWYGILFKIYLSIGHFVLAKPQSAYSIFGMLTYRQKYKLAKAEIERDPMTGLYNRAFFDRVIGNRIDAKTPFSLLLIDIDDFKSVNDTYGHLAGDRALIQLKTSLLSTFRDEDIVCRFGGDEFAVILTNTKVDRVMPVTERLHQHLANEYDRADPIYEFSSLRISIGIANFPRDGDNYENVIEAADRRLYRSKKSGKNKTSSICDDEVLD